MSEETSLLSKALGNSISYACISIMCMVQVKQIMANTAQLFGHLKIKLRRVKAYEVFGTGNEI
jgi:acyl-[acyl carrier protein]--UDP-N-acetylglucosamine O-acyltransferase